MKRSKGFKFFDFSALHKNQTLYTSTEPSTNQEDEAPHPGVAKAKFSSSSFYQVLHRFLVTLWWVCYIFFICFMFKFTILPWVSYDAHNQP